MTTCIDYTHIQREVGQYYRSIPAHTDHQPSSTGTAIVALWPFQHYTNREAANASIMVTNERLGSFEGS